MDTAEVVLISMVILCIRIANRASLCNRPVFTFLLCLLEFRQSQWVTALQERAGQSETLKVSARTNIAYRHSAPQVLRCTRLARYAGPRGLRTHAGPACQRGPQALHEGPDTTNQRPTELYIRSVSSSRAPSSSVPLGRRDFVGTMDGWMESYPLIRQKTPSLGISAMEQRSGYGRFLY